jgi:hypothetical protein
MTEDELIFKVRTRALDPRRQNSMCRELELYPPATLDVLREAEHKMGFPLPQLLGRLYTEVGNGGYGPGWGLYGITGGYPGELVGVALHDLYLVDADQHNWPRKLVRICDWAVRRDPRLTALRHKAKWSFLETRRCLYERESRLQHGWGTG